MKKISLILILCFLTYFISPFTKINALYEPPLDISAESYYLVNLNNKQIILSKNAEKRMYPASLTKIMTAIVTLENVEDIDKTTYTATQSQFDEFYGIDISTAGILAGETLTVRQLLYALLMQSANEAANIIAYNVFGSREKFINKMNEKAKEIGAENTNYKNPHGLFDENQYTTALDLYKITTYALEIPIFKEIVETTRYQIPQTNKSPAKTLVTTVLPQDKINGGVYYRSYIKGVKTGSIPESGRCLISTADIDNQKYLLIVLNSQMYDQNKKLISENKSFTDTTKIYDWVKNNLKAEKIASTDKSIKEVSVSLTTEKKHLLLYPKEDFYIIIPDDADESVIQKRFIVDDNIKAPIKANQVIGKVEFLLFNDIVGTIDLISSEDIKQNNILVLLNYLKNTLFSPIGLILLVLILIAFIILRFKPRKRKVRKIRKLKKYKFK